MTSKLFVIVGVGGTGSAVATMLSRMYDDSTILLIDADKVEASNVKRQAYQLHDVGKHKAEALAIKLNSAGNQSNKHLFHNKFIESDHDLMVVIGKKIDIQYGVDKFLIGCIDNHPARMIMEEFFKDVGGNGTYIDAANEEGNGEVVKVSKTRTTKIEGKFRSEYFPKIKKSKAGKRSNDACGNVIDEGGVQQFSTNSMAANIILQMTLDDSTGICYFDTRKLVMHYARNNNS